MATTVKRHEMFIGGEWVQSAGDESLPVVNPATGETIAEIPRGIVDQHPHPPHAGDAPRRVQAERLRQGHVDLLDRGVHESQARDGGHRLKVSR